MENIFKKAKANLTTKWDSLTELARSRNSTKHPIGQEIERNHFAKTLPSLAEQRLDNSRTSPIEMQISEHAEGVYTTDSDPTITLDEHAAINALDEFLDLASQDHSLSPEQRTEAAALHDNLNYIGTKEFQEATTGLADYYKQYLDQDTNNHLILSLMSDINGHDQTKSDIFVLDQILANFSDEDLAKYSGRLHRTLPYAPDFRSENTKVVVLDDWSISGEQMRFVEPYANRTLKNEAFDSFPQEINLLIAKRDHLENGFNYHDQHGNSPHTPVYSYFIANEDDRFTSEITGVDKVRITGFYSSVDYGFENSIASMVKSSESNQTMPPLTNIIRPYRKSDFQPINVARANLELF